MSKKIVAVNAGPRKGWNTDTLIDEAIKGDTEYEELHKQLEERIRTKDENQIE